MLKTELAKGMSAAVSPADDCPVASVVPLPVFRVPGIAVIESVLLPSLPSFVLTVVLFAEMMTGDCPVGTPGMMAGTSWFPGHGFLPGQTPNKKRRTWRRSIIILRMVKFFRFLSLVLCLLLFLTARLNQGLEPDHFPVAFLSDSHSVRNLAE